MPPSRSGRSASRRNTPVSPPISAASTEIPRQLRRSTRSKSHDAVPPIVKPTTVPQDLTTVEEGLELEGGKNTIALQQEDVAEPAAADEDGSDDLYEESSILTSESTAQIDAMDKDSMILSFPDLHRDALAILFTCAVDDDASASMLVQDLSQPASRRRKKLEKELAHFEISREPFANGRLYINLNKILRKFANVKDLKDTRLGPWRPDGVIYLANLAAFLTHVTISTDQQIMDSLEYMFNMFPVPLIPGFIGAGNHHVQCGTALYLETMSLDLELRTQYFLAKVQLAMVDQNFDPDELLKRAFFDEDEQTHLGALSEALPKAMAEDLVDRLESIRQHFSTNIEHPIDLHALREEFSWADFVMNVLLWASARRRELMGQLSTQGGVDRIFEYLQLDAEELPTHISNDDVQNEDSEDDGLGDQEANEDAAGPAPNAGIDEAETRHIVDREPLAEVEIDENGKRRRRSRPSNPLDRAQIQKLKAITKSVKARPAAVNEANDASVTGGPREVEEEHFEEEHSEEEIQESPQRPVYQSYNDDAAPQMRSSPPPQAVPQGTQRYEADPGQTAAIMALVTQSQAPADRTRQPSKEQRRRFIDPQPDAERIEWHDTQQDYVGGATERQKQTESESDEPVFETDTRSPKRRRLATAKGKQPAARPRRIQDEVGILDDVQDEDHEVVDVDEMGSAHGAAQAPPRQQRHGLASTQPVRRSTVRQQPNSLPPASTAPPRPHPRPPPPASPRQESPPPSTPYAEVNEIAKTETRIRKENLPRNRATHQVRRPYTEAEIERLLDLMKLHGTQWALILRVDQTMPIPRLQERTQVQIKDKARNMKLDYLKAQVGLPDGFANVTIGGNGIRQLAELGISHQQGEGGRSLATGRNAHQGGVVDGEE